MVICVCQAVQVVLDLPCPTHQLLQTAPTHVPTQCRGEPSNDGQHANRDMGRFEKQRTKSFVQQTSCFRKKVQLDDVKADSMQQQGMLVFEISETVL